MHFAQPFAPYAQNCVISRPTLLVPFAKTLRPKKDALRTTFHSLHRHLVSLRQNDVVTIRKRDKLHLACRLPKLAVFSKKSPLAPTFYLKFLQARVVFHKQAQSPLVCENSAFCPPPQASYKSSNTPFLDSLAPEFGLSMRTIRSSFAAKRLAISRLSSPLPSLTKKTNKSLCYCESTLPMHSVKYACALKIGTITATFDITLLKLVFLASFATCKRLFCRLALVKFEQLLS